MTATHCNRVETGYKGNVLRGVSSSTGAVPGGSVCLLEAGGGIEPPIEDLQSPALPLCYPAPYTPVRGKSRPLYRALTQ